MNDPNLAPTPRRARYPSDLSDRDWGRVSPLLPTTRPRGRPRSTDLREVVNGLNYRWTTGCAWRMLPHDFPPWSTVYCHVRQWARTGLLSRVRDALLRRAVNAGPAANSPPPAETPPARADSPA